MIHSIRLYVVAPDHTTEFIQAVRDGALWYTLIRPTQPGLVAMDLLRSHILTTGFISIEFWTSEAAYLEATRSPAGLALRRRLAQLTTSCFDLGSFSFPPRPEEDFGPVLASNAVDEQFLN